LPADLSLLQTKMRTATPLAVVPAGQAVPASSQVTTSIFEVFAKVDEIAATLSVLTAQAPTYSQFASSLRSLSQQIETVLQQSVANANQISTILVLIEAIITGMGTVANQNSIIQALQAIELALAPTAPKSIRLDTTVIEIVPQAVPTSRGP
jgi:hypothetical protein